MTERVRTYYITAAANTLTTVTAATVDDNVARHVTGIHMGISTAGVTAQLVKTGQLQDEIDASIAAKFLHFIDVDATYPPGITIQLAINNTTGAAATAVPVAIRYEV